MLTAQLLLNLFSSGKEQRRGQIAYHLDILIVLGYRRRMLRFSAGIKMGEIKTIFKAN